MNQLKKVLVLLLAMMLVVTMMLATACDQQPADGNEEDPGTSGDETPGDETPGDETPGDETPGDETPGDETTEELPFSLKNEDGTCRYTVMRSDYSSNNIMHAAVAIRKALVALLDDDKVGIATDWEDDPDPERIASQYEILIGKTNRPESDQVLAELTEYSYAIRVVGRKIVIIGDTDHGTVMAANVFINDYLSDLSKVTETLNIKTEYTPNPTEIILKDKSTGKTKPQIVTTKYPTEDVVVADIVPTEMGYAVDPTGKADSTKGIQKALNDCSKAGGGTVYLPAGTYVVSDVINVPAFVTLRGDWQDPDTGNDYGTVISVWTPSKDTKGPGLFNLGGSGGVVGLTVYYPHQSLDDIKPYGFAFYSNGQGVNYMLATVKNVTVINGYRGIGCCVVEDNAHEQMTIENFKGTFLDCGAEIYNQADVGTWQDVTISNKYWKQANATMNAVDGKKLDSYTKANAIGLKLGDLEWTEFESLKIDGYKIGIEIVQGKRIQFAGSLYDIALTNCKQGLVIHDLDPRWGMVIARGTIENGIYNETKGLVKLCGMTVTGEKKGNVTSDASDLSAYSVNYLASYTKPAANLYVATLEKNGKDVSAALQAVLDEAGKTGGVVYVPAGHYRLDKALTVPAGVELRGASSVANRDQGGLSAGTVFECFYGDDDNSGVNDQAFITLNGNYAGLNGIRIIYPENSPLNGNLNTTYTVRGKGKGVYIVNCGISASAYGVDFLNCDEHFVKKVTTCCYYNTFRLGGKNGVLSGCLQNGTAIYRTSASGLTNWPTNEGQIWAELFDPITRQKNTYIKVEGATNQLVYNTFIYGCANMITNTNSQNSLFVNIGSDNIGKNKAQVVSNSGSMVVINSMRYNGYSYDHNGGSMKLYNRLTINNKTEATDIR